MSCTLKQIIFYKDTNLIELIVECDNCKFINCHTITHASTIKEEKNILNFNQLNSRRCDNTKCSIYKLYDKI
jgi:hypothetical protein